MKNLTTLFKSLIAIIILTISIQKSFAADTIQVTELANAKNISEIKVSGNVDLELIQSTSESVTIYDQYYSENALVQMEGGQLRIASYGPNKLKVVVNVNKLTNIEASGDASITTSNQITASDLTIHLKGFSNAVMNTKAASLETISDDSSVLTLCGSSKSHSLEISGSSKVDTTGFQATKKTVKIEEQGEVITSTGGKTVVLQAPPAKA